METGGSSVDLLAPPRSVRSSSQSGTSSRKSNGGSDPEGDDGSSASGLSCRCFGVWAFLVATFWSQIGMNSFQVWEPLMLIEVLGSPSIATYWMTGYALINGVGSSFGGFIYPFFSPRSMFVWSSIGRATAQSFAVVSYFRNPTLAWPLILSFGIDAFCIGWQDTTRMTFPNSLVGNDRILLDRLNSWFQMSFDAGVTIGPIIAGVLMLHFRLEHVAIMSPLSFIITATFFLFVPSVKVVSESRSSKALKSSSGLFSRQSPCSACSVLCGNPAVAVGFTGFILTQVYRLKSVYPAIFATQVLKDKQYTAWIVTAFGLGGVIGSFIYNCLVDSKQRPSAGYMFSGAIGLALFGTLWLPESYMTMVSTGIKFAIVLVVTIVFIALNVGARLSCNSLMQAHLDPETKAGVISLRQTIVKLYTAALRGVLGLCFSLASNDSFWASVYFTVFLGLLSLTQLAFSIFAVATVDKDFHHEKSNSIDIDVSDHSDTEGKPQGVLETDSLLVKGD